jgi:heptosyltransferase I
MPNVQHTRPESICVIRLSAIGDCCHTLPVIRTIQSAWPDTKITWVIGKTEYALMEGVDGVEFITFDKSGGWSELFRLRRLLASRNFSILLHMHASMRANLASLCIKAGRRIGFDRARARDYQWLFTRERVAAMPNQHVIDGLFCFLEHLGIEKRVLRWDIPVSAEDEALAAEVCAGSQPVCVISPCSSQRFRNFRNWRSEHYAALADHLHEVYGARVVLTGGPTEMEREYGRRIEAQAHSKVTNLIGTTTLKQLLAIIERADLVICPDSGPAHMATAVGTQVVGLYATSNRHRTGPYLSQDLTVDKYPLAVRQEFDKPVEALRWGERVRNPDAMELIALEDVTAKVELVLN